MAKITVDQFIQEYKVQKEDKKVSYLKRHILNHYIEYEKKIAICEAIVKHSVELPNGVIKVNTPMKIFHFFIQLINNYTDIDIDRENAIADYNRLNKNKMIDLIVENIPKDELVEINTLLDMVYDDYILNHFSTPAILYNFVNGLNMSTTELVKLLSQETDTDVGNN